MKIHGVRIYPKSVQKIQGRGAPIYLHGRVDDKVSDFFYIFRPIAHLWKGHFFANDFMRTLGEDPLPGLREQYGSSLVEADVKSQLLLLKGDDFRRWARDFYSVEGAFLPILYGPMPFEILKRLYWDTSFQLNSNTWPLGMRAVIHMWDDIYWQLFSTVRSDINIFIHTHRDDPKLDLYYVDFDKEYPNPSNQELEPIAKST